MQILLFVGLKCKTFRYDVLLVAECIGVNGDKLPAARVKRPDLDTFVTGSCSDASCISASCICGQSQDLPALCNSDRVDCLKTLLNTKISKMHPLAFVSHLSWTVLQEYQKSECISVTKRIKRFVLTCNPANTADLPSLMKRLLRNGDCIISLQVPYSHTINSYIQVLVQLMCTEICCLPPLASIFPFGEKARLMTGPPWPFNSAISRVRRKLDK